MDKLKEMVNGLGLYTEYDGTGKIKGNSGNILSYPIFRLWINKSGKLTVKTRGIQKSFEGWENKEFLKQTLQGFEII